MIRAHVTNKGGVCVKSAAGDYPREKIGVQQEGHCSRSSLEQKNGCKNTEINWYARAASRGCFLK